MIILGENTFFDNKYKGNANNLLIGSPGTGKTRSFVIPNLMNAETESIVVLDPKGEIYDMTHEMMEEKGYIARTLDFINPGNTDIQYNPLFYCRNEDDVLKLSSIIVADQKQKTQDMFWPLSSQMLCNALVSYLISYKPYQQQNLHNVLKLLQAFSIDENQPEKNNSHLDQIFEKLSCIDPDCWALSQYKLLKKAAGRTQKSVFISLIAEFCGLLTPGITELTNLDNVDINSFCQKKSIIYVKCSDVDRSKDKLISLFFTQFFQELYKMADSDPSHALPRPVHIILDDMGANLTIPNLDGIISTSRGRNISLSLILQSIGQLKKNYKDYTSIVNSCNNIIFLGGNDIETCQEMSLRLNKPLGDILYKEKSSIFVFQQGEKPIITTPYNIKSHPDYELLNDNWKEESTNEQNDTDATGNVLYERQFL